MLFIPSQELEEVRIAFTETGTPKKQAKKFFGTPRRESKNSGQQTSPFDDILGGGNAGDNDVLSSSNVENFYSNDFVESDGDDADAELSKAAILEDDDVMDTKK